MLVVLAAPALAQDRPLTTLMRPAPLSRQAPLGQSDPLSQPDRLFNDNGLSSVDPLTGDDSLAGQRADRRQVAGPPGARGKPGDDPAGCASRAGSRREAALPNASGSGSGPGEYERFVGTGRSGAAKPAATPGERSLYGGTDRPLWNTLPPGPAAPAPRPAGAPTMARERAVAPAPGVDRPLWAESGASRPAADPCDPATRRAGLPASPNQTLFLKTTPPR